MSIIEFKLLESTVQSASIPITWCIGKKWLKKYGANGEVLLATVPLGGGKRVEWRGKYKIQDLVGYVKFLRPGKNRIFCIIPEGWAYSDYPERISKFWNTKTDGDWDYDIISSSENDPAIYEPWLKYDYLDVELPEEVFANEPPKWEKAWVNFFFSSPAIDQCDFRRRRLLAYSIQPLLIIMMLIMRFVVFISLLSMGVRGLSARPLIHPNRARIPLPLGGGGIALLLSFFYAYSIIIL